MRKVNLSRAALLKLLKEHNFEKLGAAIALGVDESSVRRACLRLNIDCEMEKNAAIASQVHTMYKPAISKKKVPYTPNTFVAVPDLHSKYVSWQYMNALCQFIADFKPEYLIDEGDLLDFECLMSVCKQKYPTLDAKDLNSLDVEFQVAEKIVSMLNKSVPAETKKYYLFGNHEFRASMLIKQHPQFAKILDVTQRIDLSGWNVLPYLEPFKLGRLNFIHGEFYGNNHVQKHLRHYQKNVLYGHTHAIAQDTMASPMRKVPIWGASIGCGCDLNPDYQRNKSNQWQHGFAYGWFDEASGDFDCQIKRVINGKFWAEGKRYSA